MPTFMLVFFCPYPSNCNGRKFKNFANVVENYQVQNQYCWAWVSIAEIKYLR